MISSTAWMLRPLGLGFVGQGSVVRFVGSCGVEGISRGIECLF